MSDGAVHLLREVARVAPEAVTDKHWEGGLAWWGTGVWVY